MIRLSPVAAQFSSIALGALVLAVVTTMIHPRPPIWADRLALTPSAVRAIRHPIVWVDARTASERERAPAPGTVWMSESAWDDGVAALLEHWTTSHVIVVFCSDTGCRSSSHVARHLASDFAINVHTLTGGYDAWRRMQDVP